MRSQKMTQNLTGTQRPNALKVIPENIPEELRAFNQWVLWDYKLRDEKWTKVPIQPRNFFPAKVNDSGHWTDFDTAVSAFEQSNTAGIGFVFTKKDSFLGIDLDKVLSPFGNSYRANETAKRFLEELKTYRELSPSETGLHFILKGHLPIGGRRHRSVEMYDCDRYFTFTGQPYKNRSREIFDGGEALKELYWEFIGKFNATSGTGDNKKDKSSRSSSFDSLQTGQKPSENNVFDDILIEKINKSQQGEKFRRLWEGDTSAYESHSEADAALCSILSFWTKGDPVKIDRIFRRSSLMRPKWDNAHSSDKSTYGQMTIRKFSKDNAQDSSEYQSAQSIEKGQDSWPESPDPILEFQPTSEPYPLKAYPSAIRDAVESFIDYAQTPVSLAASIALGYAATSVQHLALVVRDSQTLGPCSLFVLNIAKSGERKSTVDRTFEKGIRSWERSLQLNINHLEQKAMADGSSPRLIYEDATAEGLAAEIENNMRSVVLASSEGGSVFGSVGMRGEALLKALSFYNKAWDTDTQSMSRKQAKSVYLENYRISLNIAVQVESLEHWLNQNVGLAKGIGFLARFLVNIPESRIGERLYVLAPNDVPALKRFISICEGRLAKKADLEEPKKLHFSKDARSVWIEYYNKTEFGQKPGGSWEEHTAAASKSAEQAARIAGVFTLFEDPDAEYISPNVMSNAIKVAKYHLNESVRFEKQTGSSQLERDAHILLMWLAKQNLDKELTPRDISQFGPSRFRKLARRDPALLELERSGYLKKVKHEKKTVIKFHPGFPECLND